MINSMNPYSIGKEHMYYAYRFIVLPWELKWKNEKFIVNKGELKKFCESNNICLESFDSYKKLDIALSKKYTSHEKEYNGILWFIRKETKPKDTLRHLRNCFAHGNYIKRQKNKQPCIVIKNIDKGKIKAQGFLPISLLKPLITAINSCKV